MAEPPRKKSKASSQTFKPCYSEEWPCIIKSRISNHHAFCTVCSSDFSIRHSGHFDCKTHVGGARHKSLIQSRQSVNIASMFKKMSAGADSDSFSLVAKAEILMVEFIAKHNLSMSVADDLPSLIKSMCPDSTVAKGIRCGRSKTTALINEIALMTQSNLIERMKKGPFTISTDGSNDMGSSKLFPLVVRTISVDGVHSEVLSVPVCEGSATGERIFSLINDFFEKHTIPWIHCIALGCDNANVMTGQHKGLLGYCRGKHSEILLSGCPLHLVHLAAEKGAHTLPVSANDLLIDIYFYFHKSSLRCHRLTEFQDLCGADQLRMLKHGSTRWLSIGRCLNRLLTNWEPLRQFFKAEAKRTDLSNFAKKKVEKILEMLQSRSTRLYLMFLQYTLQPFEKYLTANQAESPKISSIVADSKQLIRNIMIRFVAPTAFSGNKCVQDVQYTLSYNLKSEKDILIGEDCRTYIENKEKNGLSDTKLKSFYTDVKKYFTTIIAYLLKSLPLNDSVLNKLSITDPTLITTSSTSDIRYLAQKYPALIPQGSSMDNILEEFSNFQCSTPGTLEFSRMDEFWIKVGAIKEGGQHPIYCALSQFMLGLLTVPHSSAHCERVFSGVRKIKTDQRSSMGPRTLESLLILKNKQEVTFNSRTLSTQTLKMLKTAYTNSLAKEKE